VREHEAVVLRDAATRVLDGESLRSVVTAINESGSRTTTGKLWEVRTLKRVLVSPRVAGKRQAHDGKVRRAEWPPILDDVTHRRLVAALEKKGLTNQGAVPARRYLLSGGLARCGLCSAPLAARPNNNGRRSYACVSDPPNRGCGRIRIVAEPFENDVAERVLARLLRADTRAKLTAAVESAQAKADKAAAELASAQGRLKQIGEDFADGRITATEMHAASARIQQQIANARAAVRLRERLDNVHAADAEDLVEWWEAASVEQQSALLSTLLTRVEVFPSQVRGSKLYDGTRVKVVWK
jgi:hypothetical protein